MKRICIPVLLGSSLLLAGGATVGAPGEVVTFAGGCDGSAAVRVGGLVATTSDETNDSAENVIALYDPKKGGAPVGKLALNAALGIPEEGKRSSKEADLEAAAPLGGRIYWIASHSHKKKDGSYLPARHQFFATQAAGMGSLAVVGKSYHRLQEDMLADARLSPLLKAAAGIAPEDAGGWNIESLTATPQGTLLIGFRNPTPKGKALLVPLLNPAVIVAGKGKAKFGTPILVDVTDGAKGSGIGLRDMAYWAARKKYVMVTGSYESEGQYSLRLWDGKSGVAPAVPGVDLSILHAPEAVCVVPAEKHWVLVLSDDGSLDGCKDKPDNQRQFHGAWYSVP